MRFLFFYLLLIIVGASSCGYQSNDPAQNAPKVILQMERLDQVLFNLDTLQMKDSLLVYNTKYPFISEVLIKQMLDIDSNHTEKALLNFLSAYRPIYLEALAIGAPHKVHPQIEALFSKVHYYFPLYGLPNKIIYFIGPLDGFGNNIGEDYMAIGLQMFLGASSPWYQSAPFQKNFPPYLSRHFTTSNIPITAAKNLIQDMAPIHIASRGLVFEMIELGKRQYLLKKLLPETNDAALFEYTHLQYEAIEKAEQDIWNYLLKMNLIYSTDPSVAFNMLGLAPFSTYFGNEIPGNAGLYLGTKIVASWMHEKPKEEQHNLVALLNTPAQKIFAESKYRP